MIAQPEDATQIASLGQLLLALPGVHGVEITR
jgi:hypothetical protein